MIEHVSTKSEQSFAVIPPEAIRRFIPHTPLEDRFARTPFPELPRGWPASRRRRRANGTPTALRSYWLIHRAAQHR